MSKSFWGAVLSAFLKLLFAYFIYYVLGIVSLFITFGSYTITGVITTNQTLEQLLSPFETGNIWEFIQNFFNLIINKLPFCDISETALDVNDFGPFGILLELFRLAFQNNEGAPPQKIMDVIVDIYPSVVKSVVAVLFFDIFRIMTRLFDVFENDIVFNICKHVFLFFLSFFLALASFSASIAIFTLIESWLTNIIIRFIVYAIIFFAAIFLIILLSKLDNLICDKLSANISKFWSFSPAKTVTNTIKTFGSIMLDILLSIIGSFLLFAVGCALRNPYEFIYCFLVCSAFIYLVYLIKKLLSKYL